MRLGGALVVLLLAVGAIACSKPKVGGACKAGAASCGDPGTRLVCEDGAWASFPCRGAKGCSGEGVCDAASAENGDPCPGSEERSAMCTADAAKEIKCSGRKMQVRSCRGERHCRVLGKATACDVGELFEGDPCTQGAPTACSKDRAAFLACVEGKYARSLVCTGANGCRERDIGATCDVSVTETTNPCSAELQGKKACAKDRRAILSCDGRAWSVTTPCAEGKACKFTEMEMDCKLGENCLISAKNAACELNTVAKCRAASARPFSPDRGIFHG